MRLAHHLLRQPSGVYHFRLIVPADLREAVGRKVIKVSLRTRDAGVARAYAYAWGARYAAAFAAFRAERMSKPPSLDDILRAAQGGGIRPYELELPNGTRLKADGPEDHRRAMEALRVVLSTGEQLNLPPASPPTSRKPAAASNAGLLLGEATRKYLLTLEGRAMPEKTRMQRRAAVDGFLKWKGASVALVAVSRTDVSEWLQHLRTSGLATPTLANKASYLKAFLAWAQSAGHFPAGDNPASGHVSFSMSEKRQRRKMGYQAFTPEQLRTIYDPNALAKLNEQTRWGALVGLYTGARVSEVGQLALKDFFDDESGVWCVSFTDEGEGQRLKNESSKRAVPVHPDLVKLGLRKRVERLYAEGELQLFPRAKAGSVNGMGNWLSAAFGRHLESEGIEPTTTKAKVGFHSLRKTFIQALKDAGVIAEARAQYVGHELDDEHHGTYGKFYSATQLLNGAGQGPEKTAGIKALRYPAITLSGLLPLLTPKS